MEEKINLKLCRLDVGSMELFKKRLDDIGIKDKKNVDQIVMLCGLDIFESKLVPEKEAWLIDRKEGKLLKKYNISEIIFE